MGALSLVQSDTQTQNDKKTRSPHLFPSKIQGATGCFCLFTALLPGANYEMPAPLSTGILIFFRAAFSAKKPMPNAGLQLNRARQPGSVFLPPISRIFFPSAIRVIRVHPPAIHRSPWLVPFPRWRIHNSRTFHKPKRRPRDLREAKSPAEKNVSTWSTPCLTE